MKTVGELLDDLFRTHSHPSGREYTYREVAEALDYEIDPTYIAKLRRGKIPNPGRNAILLLCRFFQVQPNYFFPELQPPAASGDDDPLQLALCSSALEPRVRRKIEELIRALLPDPPDEPADDSRR